MSHSLVESGLRGPVPEAPSDVEGAPVEDPANRRTEMVKAIIECLRGKGSAGALLIGDNGVGKTFTARQVMESLADQFYVVQLRGSENTSVIDYAAIAPLMKTVDYERVESPILVLRDITRELKVQANGRPILVFVDNVQFMDEQSALVIGQMVVNQVSRFLMACDSLATVPKEIIGLWRDGLIERIDVSPFSEQETRLCLDNMLQSPVSEAAVMELWSASAGNPRILHSVLTEQLEAQTLIRRDDVWVMSGAPFVCTGKTVDTVMTTIGSMSSSERQVADVLALSGGMTVNHLMDCCDAKSVDALQKRGYLALTHGDVSGVRLTNKLLAEVLRQDVPLGESRQLYELATESGSSDEPAGTSRVSMAVWGIDCGHHLEAGEGIAAAREAVNLGHPEQALRIIDGLPPHTQELAVDIERARACVALGDVGRARSIILSAATRLDEASLVEKVEVLLLQSRYCDTPDSSESRARRSLEDIRALLDSAQLDSTQPDQFPGTDQAVRREVLERLDLDHAERAMRDGRYVEVEARLVDLHSGGRTMSTRRLAGLWLVEIWTLTGRIDDARRIADEIQFYDVISNAPASFEDPMRPSALIGAVAASLLAPESGTRVWNEFAGTFNRVKETSLRELVAGLGHAYRGCSDQALSALLPAASQLNVLGEHGAAALAYSASAYAFALKAEPDAAEVCLGRGRIGHVETSRLLVAANSYFQTVAGAELDPSEKASVRLFSLADDERRYKTTSVELSFVCAAVRMGSLAGAQRLVDLAERVQGEQGRNAGAYGRGILARDPVQILEAAQNAFLQHDYVLARDASRLALKFSTEAADKLTMRGAQQLIRGAVAKLGRVRPSTDDGQGLTKREQEIALQAADGASNKAIAMKMHISVRTVEGHLYQVYSKLQVTSRAELRDALL